MDKAKEITEKINSLLNTLNLKEKKYKKLLTKGDNLEPGTLESMTLNDERCLLNKNISETFNAIKELVLERKEITNCDNVICPKCDHHAKNIIEQ